MTTTTTTLGGVQRDAAAGVLRRVSCRTKLHGARPSAPGHRTGQRAGVPLPVAARGGFERHRPRRVERTATGRVSGSRRSGESVCRSAVRAGEWRRRRSADVAASAQLPQFDVQGCFRRFLYLQKWNDFMLGFESTS